MRAVVDTNVVVSGIIRPRGAPGRILRAIRDPHDDMFLEAAVDGRADRIVSGDDELLAIGSIEQVRIVSSADFVGEIE